MLVGVPNAGGACFGKGEGWVLGAGFCSAPAFFARNGDELTAPFLGAGGLDAVAAPVIDCKRCIDAIQTN